jgi:hypothetical protein
MKTPVHLYRKEQGCLSGNPVTTGGGLIDTIEVPGRRLQNDAGDSNNLLLGTEVRANALPERPSQTARRKTSRWRSSS